MIGERAEVAAAEAAAVVDDRELNLLNRRHAAHRLIHRVIGAHIRQTVGEVHLLGGQRECGRILYEQAAAVLLNDRLAADMIVLVVLDFDGLRIFALVRQHLLQRRAPDRRKGDILRTVREVCHAADAAHGIHAAFARLEVFRQLDD